MVQLSIYQTLVQHMFLMGQTRSSPRLFLVDIADVVVAAVVIVVTDPNNHFRSS